MKKTHRKGFNFFRSYFDVFNELTEKDKLPFIEALLNKQFLGEDPADLKGMAKFAWISQQHSISEQVKGYETKTKTKLTPTDGVDLPPTEQVEVEVEVEEKEVDSDENPITKFTDWFNTRKSNYTGKVSNHKRLSYSDIKNLTELKTLYKKEDFEKVISNMINDKYCNENNRIVPSHFLERFDNYISIEVKPTITLEKRRRSGWSV
jgi:hypothetical protein